MSKSVNPVRGVLASRFAHRTAHRHDAGVCLPRRKLPACLSIAAGTLVLAFAAAQLHVFHGSETASGTRQHVPAVRWNALSEGESAAVSLAGTHRIQEIIAAHSQVADRMRPWPSSPHCH